MRPLLVAMLLLAAAAARANAHGGVWRPPSGGVTTPGGAGAPTTGGRGPATGGPRTGGAGDLDRWEAWWYFQRETYLQRHSAGRLPTAVSQASHLTSHDAPAPSEADGPLLPDAARARILPILVASLDDKSTEVVDAAAIAIGRSVTLENSAPYLGPLVKTLAHPARSPQQAAALALGILGGEESAAKLREIALDSAEGRKLCGATGPLDEMLRGLAALALGLDPQKENLEVLTQLAGAATTPRDVAASCVLALGLHQKYATYAAADLWKLLEEPTLDREVRAQVPIALCRLPGTRGMLPKLAELFGQRNTPNEVERSLAIALGDLALPEEGEVAEKLLAAAKTHDDGPTRHFSILALGRLFQRNETPSDDTRALQKKVQEFLLGELRESAKRTSRPYAALALGLIGHGEAQRSQDGSAGALSLVASKRLLELFDLEHDASSRGAVAIAVGLIGAPDTAARLRVELDVSTDPVMKGHLATAVALIHDRESIPRLRELLKDRALAPALRIEVARALGMLQDRDFERELITLIEKSEDIPQAAAYAKALGLLGGKAAVEPLLALAQKKDIPDFRRAFAVVALGLLAEKSELPWNTPYLVDANFTALVRPIQEVFDLL